MINDITITPLETTVRPLRVQEKDDFREYCISTRVLTC